MPIYNGLKDGTYGYMGKNYLSITGRRHRVGKGIKQKIQTCLGESPQKLECIVVEDIICVIPIKA